MNDKLSSTLQENLLILLCFDDEAAALIKNNVEIGLYSSEIYRDIADKATSFHDSFGEAIKDHLPDVLEDVIYGDDSKKSELYKKVLNNLYDFKDGINKKYVLASLGKFVRQQKFTYALTMSAKKLKAGDIDTAEELMLEGLKGDLKAFETGLSFSNSSPKIISHLSKESVFIPIGIPYLNTVSIGPAPGEILTVMAPTSRGKTWFLIHIGKFCMLARKKVLHVTLEMSEIKTMTRYYQSMFSISRRKSSLNTAKLQVDKYGRYDGLDFKRIKRPTLKDPKLNKYIAKQMNSFGKRYNLIVKQFPTGQLTIRQLQGYMDYLEITHKFIPDVLIIDYIDCMKISSDNLRIDTGRVFRELRGVGVERNISVVTATQANRIAEDVRTVTLKHMGEDYSKAATSDIVLTLCQTTVEKANNLGRIFVAKNRDEEDGANILLSQQYQIGQFALNSAVQNEYYWDDLKNLKGGSQ